MSEIREGEEDVVPSVMGMVALAQHGVAWTDMEDATMKILLLTQLVDPITEEEEPLCAMVRDQLEWRGFIYSDWTARLGVIEMVEQIEAHIESLQRDA